MGIFNKTNNEMKRRGNDALAVYLSTEDGIKGYRSLSRCPEIIAGVNKIASLVASMTIQYMENTENGNRRIIDNLSRVVDIEPNRTMSRYNFIYWVVKTMFLEGKGNSVVLPKTLNGYLESLEPINPTYVSFMDYSDGSYLNIQGVRYAPEEILHFVLNPDSNRPYKGIGITVQLSDICEMLTQAYETKKDFLASKIIPSVVVKVNADSEELQSEEGRDKITQKFLSQKKKGEPWIIPADMMDVQQIKPLTLVDVALPQSIELDKKQVASILDIPPFVLGVGSYTDAEWNNFINTRIMGIAQIIQQELTKKLLISTSRFFQFNPRSLMAYDITQLSSVGEGMYTRGLMTGNEVRNWLGLTPIDGLNDLVILENYIPAGMIGDQKKLEKGGADNG